MVVTEQFLLTIYTVLLLEVGLALLLVIIILWDIKRAVDKSLAVISRVNTVGEQAVGALEQVVAVLTTVTTLGGLTSKVADMFGMGEEKSEPRPKKRRKIL